MWPVVKYIVIVSGNLYIIRTRSHIISYLVKKMACAPVDGEMQTDMNGANQNDSQWKLR